SDSGVSEKVLSQLLTELDGLEIKKDIVVIAATNRPDILDPALIRPGRIDRILLVPVPEKKGRLEILKIFTKEMPLVNNIKIEELNDLIEGFSGADIETWCREAAMIALRENIRARKVSLEHFKEARKFVSPTLTEEIIEWYEKFGEKLKSRRIEESKEDRLFV
ncbi:MAG: AAA family ATPase, partial [Candidatus Lokiarchaeota archaeon]|nr:AAA family ATPase [Candidatus Lokiarchaeota archaeon]